MALRADRSATSASARNAACATTTDDACSQSLASLAHRARNSSSPSRSLASATSCAPTMLHGRSPDCASERAHHSARPRKNAGSTADKSNRSTAAATLAATDGLDSIAVMHSAATSASVVTLPVTYARSDDAPDERAADSSVQCANCAHAAITSLLPTPAAGCWSVTHNSRHTAVTPLSDG
jgi:hypothetical protein